MYPKLSPKRKKWLVAIIVIIITVSLSSYTFYRVFYQEPITNLKIGSTFVTLNYPGAYLPNSFNYNAISANTTINEKSWLNLTFLNYSSSGTIYDIGNFGKSGNYTITNLYFIINGSLFGNFHPSELLFYMDDFGNYSNMGVSAQFQDLAVGGGGSVWGINVSYNLNDLLFGSFLGTGAFTNTIHLINQPSLFNHPKEYKFSFSGMVWVITPSFHSKNSTGYSLIHLFHIKAILSGLSKEVFAEITIKFVDRSDLI